VLAARTFEAAARGIVFEIARIEDPRAVLFDRDERIAALSAAGERLADELFALAQDAVNCSGDINDGASLLGMVRAWRAAMVGLPPDTVYDLGDREPRLKPRR